MAVAVGGEVAVAVAVVVAVAVDVAVAVLVAVAVGRGMTTFPGRTTAAMSSAKSSSPQGLTLTMAIFASLACWASDAAT